MEFPVILLEEKHLDSTAKLEALCFPCPWNKEQFLSAIGDRFTELYGICTEKGDVAAYLLCSVIGDYAEILNIAAHPDHRKKGLAKKLLAYWLNLDHIKHNQIVLEVRSRNTPAINLYAQFGFRQIHVRKNYYEDDDAFVMERTGG